MKITLLTKKALNKILQDRNTKKMKKEAYLTEIKRISEERKLKLALLYKHKWNVRVRNYDHFTPEKLEEILSKKASIKQQRKAAIKIQSFVKGYQQRKRYKEVVNKRQAAARYIQVKWKRHLILSKEPKAQKAKINIMLIKVQKYIRGFLVYKRVFKEINSLKLKATFDYFDAVKNDLLMNSQIIIRYNWLKYKNNKMLKRKRSKKKLTKDSSISSTSSFKKGRVTFTNIPDSPSKASLFADSSKKLGATQIPEKTLNGGFIQKNKENEIKMDFRT